MKRIQEGDFIPRGFSYSLGTHIGKRILTIMAHCFRRIVVCYIALDGTRIKFEAWKCHVE